ncbi:MAG: AtuA-related protein [Chloroflexota bacterium]
MSGEIRLVDLAYARSGDKGDISNVGLIARTPEDYEILKREVTPERVKAHFGKMVSGPVEIYPMDNIEALQVVMHGALGGGATRTLRFDQTGKAMSTALLRMTIPAR